MSTKASNQPDGSTGTAGSCFFPIHLLELLRRGYCTRAQQHDKLWNKEGFIITGYKCYLHSMTHDLFFCQSHHIIVHVNFVRIQPAKGDCQRLREPRNFDHGLCKAAKTKKALMSVSDKPKIDYSLHQLLTQVQLNPDSMFYRLVRHLVIQYTKPSASTINRLLRLMALEPARTIRVVLQLT